MLVGLGVGSFRTACCQLPSGGVRVGGLGFVPVSMATTSRLPWVTPEASVTVSELTPPCETALCWTRLMLTSVLRHDERACGKGRRHARGNRHACQHVPVEEVSARGGIVEAKGHHRPPTAGRRRKRNCAAIRDLRGRRRPPGN